jgi:radical SAM superfamily enzyme YgiQ (UPF0313 family)
MSKKIQRIALVETKTDNTHVFSRTYLPRLGIPILSSVLRKAGYDVEIFFQEKQPLDMGYLVGFDMVGLSALTSTVKEAYKLGGELTGKGPVIVMGGPHPSAMPKESLEFCDYVVRGEGELTIINLLAALNNGGHVEDVGGISYKKNNEVVDNPSSIVRVDMKTIPHTDFSACKSFKGPEEYPAEIMFSRGCPYDCNFCSVTTTFGKKYRYKTVEQVMEDLQTFAGRTICFIDDNFAANPKKTKELLNRMIDTNQVPARYSCQLRINAARDEELLSLLRKTNCRIAYVGMESVNPETLLKYNKGQTLEQIVSSIKGFRKYNIGLHGMFVLGSDDDTRETIKATTDFAMANGLDTIQLCALTPFPGTAVYDEMIAQDRVIHQRWELYDGLHVVIRPKKMTPYELQEGIMTEMKRFYSWKNIFKISLAKRWRFRYRFGGKYLVNKWIEENSSYMEHLKTL